MNIIVKYLGGLSLAAKKEEEMIILQKPILGDLVAELITRNGKEFEREVFDSKEKELKDYITVVLNGRVVPHEALRATKLANGDEVAILPPILGG